MFDEKSVPSAHDHDHDHDHGIVINSDSATASAAYGLDFDGNSRPDILWQNPISGENKLWYMEGDNGSQYHASITIDGLSGDWKIQTALDFNVDGHQDLLWRNESTGQNEVWFMGGDGGVQTQGKDGLTGIGSDWEIVGAADFNQDGHGDLLWRNQSTGQNEVWFMDGENGTDVVAKDAIKTVGNGWDIRGVADFNRDGQADILWRHQDSGKNAVWYMGGNNGTEIASDDNIKTVGGQWDIVGAADFNGDGAADLMWRNEPAGKNVVWYMDGDKGTDQISDVVLPYVQGPWQATVTGWQSQSSVAPLPVESSQNERPQIADETPQNLKDSDGFDIRFDYRFDNLNWFDKKKKAVLEAAANVWENIIKNDFKDVKAGTTVHASHPTTGAIQAFKLDYDIDDLVVFAYANDMGGAGGKLAEAGATTYDGSDRNTSSVFQPWLGEIEFDISEPWYFNANTSESVEVPDSQPDMLSVAVHELGHILGISSSIPAFRAKINNGKFAGEKSTELNRGNAIPLDASGSHIADNFEIAGLGENSLDPQLKKGDRKLLTTLDATLLDDIGYSIDYSSLKPPSKVQVFSVIGGNQETTKLQADESYLLRWQDNLSEGVKLELYEGSKFIRTIDSATDSDGQFTWKAPADLANNGRYYKLKVTSLDDRTVYDFSDNPFTINSKSSLAGATFNDSSLKIGNQYNLVWNDNLKETVKIELYKGDSYVRTLTGSTASDGRYQWRVPSYVPTGEGYRLKLTSTNDASIYNFSDVFKIHN